MNVQQVCPPEIPPWGGEVVLFLWAAGDNFYVLPGDNAQMHRIFNIPWEPPVLSLVTHLRCPQSWEKLTSPLF